MKVLSRTNEYYNYNSSIIQNYISGTDNSILMHMIINCPNSGKSEVVYNIMKVSNYAEIAILVA